MVDQKVFADTYKRAEHSYKMYITRAKRNETSFDYNQLEVQEPIQHPRVGGSIPPLDTITH